MRGPFGVLSVFTRPLFFGPEHGMAGAPPALPLSAVPTMGLGLEGVVGSGASPTVVPTTTVTLLEGNAIT